MVSLFAAVALCSALAACGDSGSNTFPDKGGGGADGTIDFSADGGGTPDITIDTGLFGDSTVDSTVDSEQARDQGRDGQGGDSTRDGGGSSDTTRDTAAGDAPPPDTSVDGISATICGSSTVLIAEIAVGQPDYVVLKNYGSAPVDINGYKLEMTGISPSSPDVYTVSTSTVLAAGASQYFFENSSGTLSTDINTGANIPFYDGLPSSANAVALYDATGKLVDYWAVIKAVNLPAGAAYPAPSAYPTGFSDPSLHSVQRSSTATTSKCPNFDPADFVNGSISRP